MTANFNMSIHQQIRPFLQINLGYITRAFIITGFGSNGALAVILTLG